MEFQIDIKSYSAEKTEVLLFSNQEANKTAIKLI